jgi:hypothetical protein
MARTQKAKRVDANVKDDPGLKEFLETQEKLTEDYLGNPRGKRRNKNCAYTLVRSPQGDYFLVSKNKPPIPVKHNDEVHQFLQDLNDLVSDYLAKHERLDMVAGPGVHVGTAEIFPK